ncbi:transposase [Bacteroidia bacterium]|nr:transposase [Bacteroidia bacterium]GHU90838.1 transposase [Bacteroidia bacterium]
MTKEEFIVILERQQSSGLSIKDFCLNESYTASSFHYWKSKFGMSRPYRTQFGSELGFAPINLTPGGKSSFMETDKMNQIEVEFPNGITIRLNNFNDLQMAGAFLSQTLHHYVLPE